jgi:anaerobic magnesium-protoporphyrin IX monomethyl ester cyclase
MKIHIVSLEDGITALGFRKMAAYVERLNADTKVFYVGTNTYRSFSRTFRREVGSAHEFTDAELDQLAHGLAGADIIAFSSMTGYSRLTRRLAARVREVSPKSYVMWGGIHPIIYPEDAIQAEVDAICTGEGEFAFEEFLDLYRNGRDFTGVRNFWFRHNGTIHRNGFRPLQTAAELESLPFPKYGGEEWIYRFGKGFAPVTLNDYVQNHGLAYPTIWSIGCPLHCTFCGNTVFIANDPDYKKLRHPSAAYVVREVQRARQIHPHISSVLFHDDSFMAIPLSEITEFAVQWRETVKLPMAVFGVIPNYVRRDKLEVLTWAGMNRIRMGIQSGSERILQFYRRPTPIPRVEEAATVIAEFSRYHINPAYDIIVDNPIETRQDVIDTLELIYRLARPFTCNIFSLRVIPNTVLEQQMKESGIDLEQIDANYLKLRPTWANVVLFTLLVVRPPRRVFNWLLRRVRAYSEPQRSHPILIKLVSIPWLLQQGLRHLRFAEFSVITGRTAYLLWRVGLLKLWRRLAVRRLDLPAGRIPIPVSPTAAQ